MSRTGSATYSAESIQAQYERLIKKPKGAEDKNNDIFTDLARRTPHAVGRGKPEMSTPSRSGAGRLDEASNAINSPADGADRRHCTVRKPGPQNHAEHSARMRRVWAKRRALGTNGHRGGPPKASTIAKAKEVVPTTTPSAGTSLAPATKHQKDSLPSQTQPIMLEGKVGRDANQHQQSLAQIVPAAALVASGRNTTSLQSKHVPKHRRVLADRIQHGAKRHTCRSWGMNYANKANHYRVFPKIGSEHRRRLAANHRAAEGHLRPATTNGGVESVPHIPAVQTIFKISSREQSLKLLMSRKDGEHLGEVRD